MRQYTSTILLLLLLLASCVGEREQPFSPLVVETETVTLDAAGGEYHVGISGASGTWSAAPEADWITLIRDGEGITLLAAPNEASLSRTTRVKVFAPGVEGRVIAVEQSAAGKVLTLSADSAVVSFLEGSTEILYKTNISPDRLEIDAAEDWVTVSHDPLSRKLTISVAENTENEERQSLVRILVDGEPFGEEIVVTQEAKPVYYLPSPQWGLSPAQVRSYEEGRGNSVTRVPGGFGGGWGFKTRSREFDYIEYQFNAEQKSYIARLYTSQEYKDKAFTEDVDRLLSYLKGEGFVASELEADSYYSESKRTGVKLIRSVSSWSGETPYLEYTLFTPQPEPYPTLPLEGFLGIFADYDGDKTKYTYPETIEAYESAHEGILNPTFTKSGRAVYDAVSPYRLRFYAYSESTKLVRVASFVLEETTPVFFMDELGNPILTNEFSHLMADNGFENTFKEPDYFVFVNSERRLVLSIFYQKNEFFPTEMTLGVQVKIQ